MSILLFAGMKYFDPNNNVPNIADFKITSFTGQGVFLIYF